MNTFLRSLLTNPLDDASGWRSKRVQGLLSLVVALVLQHNGWLPTPEQAQGFIETLTSRVDQIGAMWAVLGTIDAKGSARPF